jgi:NAD(P)-dependent dehydrogenase (short-subunit alcohol dehydrogenase family)
LVFAGDIGDKAFCEDVVERTVNEFGRLDVLVNNAPEQHPQKEIGSISEEQLLKTFRTNIFAMFYLCQAAVPHLKQRTGSSIINTTSVTDAASPESD